MTFWDWFRGKRGTPTVLGVPTPTGEKPIPNENDARRGIDALARTGMQGGPTVDEARAALAQAYDTPLEGRAMDALVRAANRQALPDDLLLSLGSRLLVRGEAKAAEEILERADTPPALLLRADLAARRGDSTAARCCVERVLFMDFDYPGARERYQRWNAGSAAKAQPNRGTTVYVQAPDAPFDLVREKGRGGAAVVYEARDRDLARIVALKLYHAPENSRDKLLHEARVAVELGGPNIVRVFDVDPYRGWVALEWAGKGTLRDAFASDDPTRVVPLRRWALPLARALANVHAKGWVHNDIKPANVLFDDDDTPILTDFGIARRTGHATEGGSRGYLSPERLAGRRSDPRDDVFAFGCMLEQALSFVRDNDARERMRPLVERCLGDDHARPADAAALCEGIEAWPA
jgi:serine/threonine-protein kinase